MAGAYYFTETHVHFSRDVVFPYQLVEPNEILILGAGDGDVGDEGDLSWVFTTGTQHIITGEEGEFLFIHDTTEFDNVYWIYNRP